MARILILLATLLLGGAFAQDAFAGDWEGVIGPDDLNLSIILHFEASSDGLTGTLDIPAQGTRDLGLAVREVTDDRVIFAIQEVPGEPTFDGKLVDEGLIMGTFSQGGQTLPFRLERRLAVPEEPPVVEAFLGSWQGVVGPDSIALEAGVTFEELDGAMAGRITIPAQGFEGLVDVRAATAETINFVIEGMPGNPTFEATLAEGELQGTFTQSGSSFPFTLQRGDAPLSTGRPQDPQAPFPYREEEVTYANGEVTLAGTLTLPEGEGPFPALLMITGSGAQDRNGSLAGHRPFLVIADAVTRAGVAVLRVDDRGVGGSGGELATATYDDLVSDIEAGLAFLKVHSDIDASRVGLFGHSEGGYLAPLAAAQDDEVAFVILMAGPSVSGAKVLELQNRLILELQGASQAEIDEQIRFLRDLKDALQREAYDEAAALVEARVEASFAALPENERPGADAVAQVVAAQQASIVNPNFRSFFLYDPQPALQRLTVPILAVYGNLDVQVPPVQSVGPLRFALRTARNDDVTIKVFDRLNHLMQPAIKGGLEEYSQIETTIAPEVLTLITDWLKERVE